MLFVPKTDSRSRSVVLYLSIISLFGIMSCSSNKATGTQKDTLTQQKLILDENTKDDKEKLNTKTEIPCKKRLSENFSKISNSSYSSGEDIENKNELEKKLARIKNTPDTTHGIHPYTTLQAHTPNLENSTDNIFKEEAITFEQESPCITEAEQAPFGLRTISKARSTIGDGYLNLSKSMDDIFSGNDASTFSRNESHLRLSTQATYFENGDIDQDISLRAKLDLPKTAHRFQLFYDSRFEQDESLEERNAAASSGERVNRRDSVAGLEYGRNKKDAKWRYGIRVGARTGVPLRMFTRLRLERRWNLSDVFSTKLQQDFWYLDGIGFGETTYFDLKTKINKRLYLLNETEIQYEDEKYPISYYHAFNMLYRISDRSRVRYRLGAIGSDDENAFIDQYFTSVTYTYRLYKEWLYVSFIPEIIFRAQFQTDNEFDEEPIMVPTNFKPWDPEASFTLKFDVFSN